MTSTTGQIPQIQRDRELDSARWLGKIRPGARGPRCVICRQKVDTELIRVCAGNRAVVQVFEGTSGIDVQKVGYYRLVLN